MPLVVQHSDQSEIEVAPKVEKDGFAPQYRTMVRVDTLVGLWVLEVVLVGPQGEAVEVNLEGCRTTLANCKTTLVGLMVGPIRVFLAGHTDNQAGPKVDPGRVVLAGDRKSVV